jgi:hypothetical protein
MRAECTDFDRLQCKERILSTANDRIARSLRESGIILPMNDFAKLSSSRIIVGQNHVMTASFTAPL